MALCEWGVDHVHINANWTDEQFNALICRRIEIKRRESEQMEKAREGQEPQNRVDNAAFFAQTGLRPEIVNHGHKSR